MRRPNEPERLYLDFDGFFASVEQAARPRLRGRPVGVVPFEGAGDRGILIACSREAKERGVKNIMSVREALRVCDDLELVAQSPDLYRRAHNALIAEIMAVIPIAAIKSIDEMTADLVPADRANPMPVIERIKSRLRREIGPYITCSVGVAANRQLAKMACKAGKWVRGRYGDGHAIWHPADMPKPLLGLKLDDIPGVGERLKYRLCRARIFTMSDLLATEPKHMRALWGNVTGERLWYALHGYDIQTPPQGRGMFGHGRVLPPDARTPSVAYQNCRILLIKAARRMRRENYAARRLWLWVVVNDAAYSREKSLPSVHDDQAVLEALQSLWGELLTQLPLRSRVLRIGVTLGDLVPSSSRQLDALLNDDRERQQWERATGAIDALNARYGRTVISVGGWTDTRKSNVGGKISYTRIPSAEDFS